MANLAPKGSLGSAEHVPERPSNLSQTGEELSPKNGIQKENYKKSSEKEIHANLPASGKHVNPAAVRDVTAPTTAASSSENSANPASLIWGDIEMEEVDSNAGYTLVVRNKKRRLGSTSPEHAARQPNKPGEQRSPQQRKRPTGPRTVPPREIKATRANIAEAKARQTSSSHENYIFVELCPDIPDYSYLQAMGKVVGGPVGITQFNRMNGHYIVGLATRDLARRLVEGGLEIEGTTLRVFPYRKRAERIVVANLPGFVEDKAVVDALRPFGNTTSIAPILVKMGEYTFTDGRREAFVLLHDGITLEKLPTRLDIKSKGDNLPAYLSFGIKCSKCGKQGHRRANCPALARQGNGSPRQAASPTDARPPPPPPPQQPRKPAPAPATPAPPIQPAKTTPEAPAIPSAPHPAEPMDLAQPAPAALPAPLAAPRPLEPGIPSLEHKMAVEKLTSPPSTPARGKAALEQLLEHLGKSPNISIDWYKLPDLNREEAQKLLTSETTMKRRASTLTPAQVKALNKLHDTIKPFCPDSNSTIRKTLQKTRKVLREGPQHHVDIAFVQETNAFHLGSGQDLCLGYSAVVLAHPVAISGSGLACVFGPGVAVLHQRILWPGHIALATIDVRGEEMTAIAVHLAHEPRERNRQLELLAATAAQEEEGACWIIGDFNIRDRGPSSSSSSDALAALLDLAALVDVATQFDAAHLPTRVAMHGDQVESNRLDRILVPAGVLDRASIYATSHYHLSDHRLVLLQVGPPTTAVSSPTQPRLAAMLRSGLALEHLAGYIRELEEDTAHDDDDGTFWDRWTSIKAGLLAEARSLHDPRHAASDSYVYRARRYIAAQLEASSIRADYPSLPDLARAIRLRRPVSVFRDEEDNVIEGPELRRRAFATFQPRFARPTSDPAAGAAFIASSAPTTTTRELSEEDPLHRPDISPSEIAHAIEHLPRGKAPGWDGLPCELLVAFNEDFFAEALARVFAASRLRGALPPSTRRSSICLVPKARGGRGLDGYRPVALPSADYRVLAAILHRRLKPHLRTLVPECQTYAVPGRSPSWNIAMVTDAIEEATALGSPLAVMGVDLESAFDSLDRGFLESLLTSLRLPPAFMAWINILYAGADATIRAGGFHTTAFPLLNGLRQGCAVSAALFSIATGPLLRRLELTLGVGNVIAYADDIVLLFHRDGDFERVATVFEEYKQASGVGVNLRKSAGLWCCAWRNRGDSPLGASWSTTSIRVLGLDIAPRSTVAHREQHLLALLENACRKWTPFTRGLSLVGRARAANTLVGSVIQHHLHGYLPSPPTIAKLQARLARFVWGQDHTAWLPADVMARPVAIGGLGLLDLATQLQLACLKGVQVALRGGRNAFSWLVESGEAWIHPPPDGTRLQPRRLRLLKLWEEASNILSLNHRALPTAQLLDLPIIGGCRFLRPPDLLAPARWSGSRVRDLIEEENLIARPTRSVLADATALGAFCRRLTSENAVGFGAESTPSSSSLAAAVVLRGTATPFLNGLTTRSARRALDRPRLAATPISRFLARWTPTINPPSRIDWASLRRCAYSGHEADAALKLALHALPHPAHPASVGPSCPACGSIDRSLGHRYWCCRSIRPLIREAFNIIGRPPDLQAWIFGGSGLEDDALSILASAKLRIYRYFVQVGLGEAVEDPLIGWSRTLQRRESPGCAEKVPERPSILLPTGEELSPKDINMKKIIEISSENQKYANSPAGDLHVNPAAARGDVTAPKTAATTSATLASPASLNWADSEMAEADADEGYTVVKRKKRRLVSPTPDHAAKQPSRPAEKRGSQQQKRPTGPRSMPPQEIKATRANIADAKARQNSTNHENYIFVELCPDIPDYYYLQAIGNLVGGPRKITQFNRMNGHYVVGLAGKDLASRLVEVGLDIEGTHLKVFPYRKRAERIIIANLPGFVEDSAIVEPLRNFGTVTSIAPIMIKMWEYTFNDGRREAFILLREGVRLESLPTRLTIKSKGDTLSAFLSFGIKCSKCGKHGHRRANCPALARQGNGSPRQAASPTDARPRPPPPPPPPQQPRKPAPAPATPASPVQPAKSSTEAPVTPSAHHPAEPRDLAQPAPVALPAPLTAPRPPEPETFPLDIEMSEEELTSTPSASPRGKPAFVQLQEHLKQFPNLSIDWDGLPGIDREDAQRLLTSKGKMEKRAPSLSKAQVAALDQETNAFHFGSGQDLCLGYSAVILAHPVAISGSGLACVFGPGVAVLQQRILWPGHIALATIDVRGEEMTAIAVHLAHEPRERNRQLELLAATAAQEEEGACWIIGDFNIRDRGPSSSSLSDALAALLDLAALVDVATQFDAAHLPTRVAMHGDQVESNRLDRILVPAGVLDRVSIYATSHYHLSDHRLVLLQVGPPTTTVSSPTQPRLAAMLRSGLALEHLAGYIRELEEDTAHDDDDGTFWDRWTSIKAGLLAEARSLHDPRHAANDSYVYRARRYIAAQLEASSIRADYPSLPDLARAIRLRRPVSVIRDEQDNIIEGPELRRKAFATFQPRFARPTSDPAAGAAFIASSAPTTTTRELSEEDPLHRPDISPSEIAHAIEHLPRGKAPGWDGLPCELLVAFNEDFFAEALARVFAASRLRGALPPSTRRSSICLVPKARGGRGLDGYRPVALPSADYRVLAAILHRRLKPHLRTLVPECQTYAVPGRSPSWNIAMVTDAIEEATALGSPLAVMGVDLESAFDSLDRGFLESLLTSLRLPPAFMAWINILYAGADATIRAGGFHTTAFPLLNGLRQGCAVSAALFSIATGPLLRRLELTLGVGNVIAYADDIVLLFHRDGDFERCGAWRNRGDSPLGASWSTTSIRVLGLDIAPRSTIAHREQHLLALLENACRKWTPFTRGLSLVGRARAANTLVGSVIQHHLHGYLPSPPTIAKLQARLARFVWGQDHTAWLPADVMARPVAIGGLGRQATCIATLASPASLNWADSEMAEADADEGYTVVKRKKRRLVSPSPDHAAKQPSRPAEKRGSQQQKRPTGPRSMPPQEIKATRANIADAKARQNSTNHENYIFVELCPDIPDYYYLQAIGNLVGGPRKITQFNRMNGHYVVGLAGKDLASRLVEVGLDIEGTHLKVFPYRKRAERIIIANLPGFVEDSAIVEPLRNFGTVTSIAPIMIKMGEYTFNNGRREAFILLREGVRLESLPTRLTIKSKGDTLSAFLSFGIKCSKCGKHGHRRANCPALARQGNGSPRQAASPTDARPRPPPPPPPPQQPRKPAPAPATPASPVQPAKSSTEAPVTPSAHHPAEPRDLAQPAPVALPAPLTAPRPPEPETSPLDIEMSEEELTSTPSASPRGKPAFVQLQEHLEQSPNLSIDWDGLPGIDREDAQRLLTSKGKMEKRAPSLSKAQVAALDQETNAFHLGSGQDLCLGYSAVILAHPVAISGSGLACVFGPGVAVLQQRILWPGHIALATIDVRGEEMTAIAVHLAHEPRERNRQLELLAATAAQEEEGACWIIGDFNIRDRGPSSSSLSDALAALLDLAALVDVATQFDAAHLPTRVAMHGDQVESNRLDRILVPAGVLDRVSIYATSHYHLSDHRLVLLQVGPPTTTVSSPTQPRLAAMLRSGLALEHLAGYIRELEEDTAHDDDDGTFWDRWTSIKAGLLAEARSLHDPRHAANDSYVYRARRYIAAQLEASSIRADYPSLPDLARAIRLRRPVSVIRDEQDNIIEGPELRRKAFATFQPRFARPTSDPAAGAAFIASSAPTTTTRELSEEDPLHRPDISPSEIAHAIEHLPRGKAPGWDGLPCELLVAFNEDFFAEALARVFAASRLRGALPPSTRRSSICLVPKARGGRGLDGYRPVALPSADYRVLAAILHRRLKPHLRTLVPECQTYAVPGRSPSWNIAMVTDAIEEATALGSPLAVMGVDLESAFDSLDRGFLESLLTSLRLPPAFMAWINILYAGADATIRAGGFHTTAFPLLNGLRQGCAVSAALFSIATGPLLRRLELTLGVGNVIAYADDIVLLFHRDGDFERCGAWRNRGDSPLGASWSTTSIRVLGLDIAPRSTIAHREQHLLALLENACRKWTPFTRGLSLVGRARAANTLVGSVIQHHLHGYLPSPPTIAKLQARLARFVWGQDHTAWLPADVMARPVAIGGLGRQATCIATLASPASLNWADSEMAEADADEGYTVVKRKKRRLVSPSPDHAAKQPSRPAEKRGSQQQKRPTGPRSMPPQEIKATRANIADAKARQNSTNHENYIFVELCPDIPDYYYLQAIGNLVGGPRKITQFNRMNGHYVVGLAGKDLASRLVEVGLDIEGTHLKVFPYRKRAERIIIANLPGFVEDSAIVEPLRNFGTVTSIAPIMIKMGEYTFNNGRREAFILLREGVRLESLPTRLTIKSKGDTLSAFLSFGIKCSKCGKHGHRRANCPALARQGNGSPRQAASPTDARPRPPPPPPPPQQPRKPAPAPATPASPVQPAKSSTEAPVTPSAHHPAEPRDLAQPAPVALPAPLTAPRPPEPETSPLDIEMSEEELTSTPSASPRGKPAFVQLQEHLEQSPNLSIDWDGLPGIDREDAQRLLTSKGKMEKRAPSLSKAQVAALDQETNAFHLGSGQDLCLGYSAVILAHPVAISGSGLACVFGPGVAVLQQRILWPGHIALATIDVRGEEMTAIAVHLAHEPRERNRQLELLAATAAQEEEGACWIIGDFNIRDRGPSSSSLSDALAALLDLAALVDVATQFDAAHLPTRVAMHGDQVESNRLDRILVPAGVLDRVSIYATSHYHLSDHRLVLLQVGPPTTTVSSPTQPRLAAMLRSGLALEHLAGYIRELEEDTAHDDDDGTFWDRWTSIKAGLLAEARSLHDPRHAANDSYVYRARRYIAAQLEASSIRADYPSLPDLARAIRLRRPVSVIRDEQDNIIEGPELRRKAFATFQPRFARPTSDPAAGAAFIASSAPTTTTRELSEEDPLHRPDISPSEIAHAIEHLPRGKAPGWDGLPCELLVAFNEDFFAEALARVFAASRLRGALPPSTRRSSICLVPKARGGRGLDGYRPVALPSADYRVLAAILHRRLKPHLRTLVPECQTYAVPGRSPSWNIAMVTDAIEEATALGSPLAVMGVDLESAFDSLDRGFLESLLTSLRLPPAFMAWINILYAGADATIRAGGFHTTAFPLLNGLRQGCAVSAALFSIATGPLLRRLELTLGVGNVIAYADDIVLLFHRDGDFERCGAWRNRGDSPLGASWSTTSIRVLGLDIAPRSTIAHREQHLLALLENACRKWTPFTRGLSLVGRARAANTLVGSVIQHHLHGYLPSPPTIAKLQARLARFVWGQDHTAWLPADVMARPVAIGGLGRQATCIATLASPASLNWADSEMAEADADEGYTVVKRKKRRLVSPSPDHAAKQPSRPAEKRGSQQQKRPTGPRSMPPQEIKATRANIADAKARQNSTNHENYIFVELCPDIPDYYYLQAIGNLVGGPRKITQFNRMNGHYVVGLAGKDLASRLVEVGLDIEGTHLKVFPYRKRAERIIIANLPGFVEDSAIVEPLRNFGTVTSIAPIMIKMGEYTFNNGRREAFILLREGVRLESLPTRLTIKSKGDTLSAFLSFGIKCSKCGKHGHRRANCPALARQGNGSPRQAASPTDARPRPPPPPPPPQQPRKPAPAPATPASPVQPAKSSTEAPVTPSAHHPAEPRDLAQPAPVALPAPLTAPRPPEPETSPLDIEMSEEELTSTPSASPRGKPAFVQLQEHLEQSPNLSIDWDGLPGIDREDAQRLLTSKGKMEKRAPSLSKAQVAALDQETNAFHLGSGQDLCLGYSAVILAHPVAISGSGLACVFGPGVAVLQQRILWPGHIALATIDVRGEEMTAIAVHLAHEPRERNRQLELLAATAAQEEEGACWIIGDFNIRDRGPSSSSSSDALAALLDLAALVDVATQFDAAHLPTRVSMHGDQVESNRLDRILVPAGVLDRVSIYATSHYHLSDHRLVLLQVGPPTTAVSSPTQPRLAAMLRSGLALEHLAGYIRELEEDTAHDDDDGTFWDRWTSIKAGLLAEARSLHDPRHAANDSYVYRARRYIAAQLEASSIRADYPSLPDLARAIRLRRPVSVIRDEQDNIIEGPELRRRAFATFQPRFARPTSDPAAGAAFIASSAPTTTTRELSEEDPLHRPDISPSEIAHAIEHLPRGKAPGWDGLPCELLVAFNEDFFAEALARVFAASRLRGALPPSTRRSSICLVPKARGGRGLDGYRPVALPSADYRVLAAILHWRLKPLLRTLVPECQTYAVPGRSPSWNIAMVTDAIEEATALGSPLAVMGVDLESAFDSLDRGFLESLLTSLRLPPAFMAWINILYAGADATIRAGGFHTTAFPLLNGLRQGCAVSAALFSIATGPLLRRLELTLGVGNVIAYADDIVLLFHRDGDFERVATVFEEYKQASGVGVNLRKSAGLWCGAWRNRGDSPLGASWSTTSIRVLGLDIAPRSTVAHREQHLLALLENACRKWTPFTRGLSLVGRARAANTLVGSVIQHHLHGYLPSPPTIAKLQARLARFVWGQDHTAWLPADVMARPVAIGGLGLLDLATQLQLACLKGVQVALRGGRNAFSWLVESGEAWIHPPPDGTRLQPRRLRLLKLWEEASNILSLNHRALPTAQLLDLPIIGGCRFLRPPDLLAPARWSGSRVRDLIEEENLIARPTRSVLADATARGAFCRRLTSENAVGFGAESTPSSSSLAAAVVLRGTATPFLNGLTTRSARRALDRPRLAATPISRFLARWTPTINPPSRIDWASLRRCAYSGHEADAALKLALHALPHPAHPASVGPSCPACGSIDRSLGHRYWCCRSIRPLIREAFNIIGRPPDLQAWIFGGSGLEDDALSILASAKLRIYRYFVQVGLGEAVEDPLIAWSRTLQRRGFLPPSPITIL
ncbi:hypothetical protein LAZ67_2003548 [Cordylochernes scorpioides]|uniref:Reverse transcriptase n=1 Tax=Cordylochernes scorpioides TaxID=51811 RepID=A0ABY6K433_9ARAC|nr:hypothetical protein LAZ67_2003548 [Cordylochernes scorpioides]